MPMLVFSEEWLQAWRAHIDASERYRQVASTWRWPVALTVTADSASGIPEDRTIYLELDGGVCSAARFAAPEDEERAAFVFSASPAIWQRVLTGNLEPMLGVVRGDIRLTRGSLASLVLNTGAARELVRAAAEVDAVFPSPAAAPEPPIS